MRFRRLIEAIGRSLVRYSEVPATSVSPQNPENRRVYSQDVIVPPSAVSPAGPDFKALAREVEARMVKITPTLLGMTLRDYFAAAALPAVIANCASDRLTNGESREQMFARKALEVADALIAASKTGGPEHG